MEHLSDVDSTSDAYRRRWNTGRAGARPAPRGAWRRQRRRHSRTPPTALTRRVATPTPPTSRGALCRCLASGCARARRPVPLSPPSPPGRAARHRGSARSRTRSFDAAQPLSFFRPPAPTAPTPPKCREHRRRQPVRRADADFVRRRDRPAHRRHLRPSSAVPKLLHGRRRLVCYDVVWRGRPPAPVFRPRTTSSCASPPRLRRGRRVAVVPGQIDDPEIVHARLRCPRQRRGAASFCATPRGSTSGGAGPSRACAPRSAFGAAQRQLPRARRRDLLRPGTAAAFASLGAARRRRNAGIGDRTTSSAGRGIGACDHQRAREAVVVAEHRR